MKQFKNTTKSPTGTSFHDTVIRTTPAKLIKVLGEPTYNTNNGSDKVNLEWVKELVDGDGVFTVYDYKEYRPLDMNEVVEWHIGGNNKAVTEKAKWAVELAFSESNTDLIAEDGFQFTDKVTYSTTHWTIETSENTYFVTCQENDFDDTWSITSDVEGDIDIDSELGQKLIGMCEFESTIDA